MTERRTSAETDTHSTASLLALVDAEQSRLREILAAGDESQFAERPPNGKWSVMENVRHLLFAEQAHLGGFVEGARKWSPLGYTPKSMLRARKLPTDEAAPSLREVLDAWAAIHETIRDGLVADDREKVRVVLGKHLRHLRAHVDIVGRLFATQAVHRAQIEATGISY